MGIIDQIKLANAGRRMYNSMCNKCRRRLTQEFHEDYKRQKETGASVESPQEVVNKTLQILCPKCQEVYREAMENR